MSVSALQPRPAPKTYGRLLLGIPENGGRKMWALDVPPHIAMRAKRMFPRYNQGRASLIYLIDTTEIARDLEWFIDRFPLDLTPDAQAYLSARAEEHRDTERAVEDILIGGHRIGGWREPARPGRDYQTAGADLAWTKRGVIIGDDIGLGKTQTGLMLLRDPNTLPALVVTLTGALPEQWLGELREVFPWLRGHVITSGKPYDIDADVLIINYHKLSKWRDVLGGQIKTVIFDEAQELRRSGTDKYNAAAHIADHADWRLGLTATPVYNYGDEIHTIYQVISPDALGTRDEFLREWGGRSYGQHVSVDSPSALGGYLRDQGLLLRRTRKEVGREIPEPIKIMQEIPANEAVLDEVKGDVRALAQMLLDDSGDAKERWRAAGDIDWKLRQATGVAKAPFVAEYVRMLLESEEAVVLGGWHRAVYHMWQQMLAEFNPVMFTGSETPARKVAAKRKFMDAERDAYGRPCRVMMMSLRAGAGLDGLQKRSSCAVFGELDWSPEMHDQFIGRLARDGQQAAVAAHFLVTGSGSDPAIAETLGIKQQQAQGIVNPHDDASLFGPNIGTSDRSRTQRLVAAILGDDA